MTVIVVVISLNKEEQEKLLKPVRGQGGFQDFMVLLQKMLDKDIGVLSLTPDILKKIQRYYSKYGNGGFQSRLPKIVEDLASIFEISAK